jgi:hypothetical protein
MITVSNQGDGTFDCNIWATPYYADAMQCTTVVTGIPGGYYIYNVSSWVPPAQAAINGDFETGCGDPWTWTNGYVSGYVKKCDKTKARDCISGNYYFQSFGNTSQVDPELTYDFTMTTIPIVDEMVNYNASVYVKGTTGSFVIIYPHFRTLHPILAQGQATGQWEKIEFTLTGLAGLNLEFDFTASGEIDWAVDALSITKA